MRTKKMISVFLSAALTIIMSLPMFASADSTITPTFDDLLTMSKEEICALSEEMPALYQKAEQSYEYLKYYQVAQYVSAYDDKYRENPDELIIDVGLPDNLIEYISYYHEEIVSADDKGNIQTIATYEFSYDFSALPEYEEETVYIASYLTFSMSSLVGSVSHDYLVGDETTTEPAETTTADTSTESTTLSTTTTAAPSTTAAAPAATTTTAAATTTTAAGGTTSPKTGDGSVAAILAGCAAALAGCLLCRRKRI